MSPVTDTVLTSITALVADILAHAEMGEDEVCEELSQSLFNATCAGLELGLTSAQISAAMDAGVPQ